MKVIECPRDAMQGLSSFIPTETKVSYINQLLKVGFDTIDFGSFVSPKAIPQMKDTAKVLQGLDREHSDSKLLAIVANLRGAKDAVAIGGVDFLGFPLSVSETFQKRNTNRTIKQALVTVEDIQNQCVKHQMQLVTYLSMGFGNPYNDPYDPEIVGTFTESLVDLGITIISLADTIGVSNPENISYLFSALISQFPSVEFGAHLHSHPAVSNEKVAAAYNSGCRRFDGALGGYGGCPMADDQLVGNIPTESLLALMIERELDITFDMKALKKATGMVPEIFIDSL